MLNTGEEITCSVLANSDDRHFEGECEDCDARYLSRLNLGQVEDRFEQGRISRNQLDAYRWVWALLSPTGSNAHWRNQPYVMDPDVNRIAGKLCRIRNIDIPAELYRGGRSC
jgi:hypothetical protein